MTRCLLGGMQREFGTEMAIEMAPEQVFRARRYMDTVNSRRRDTA